MAKEIDGKLYNVGDTVVVEGRTGTIYKFYNADGITSVAIDFGGGTYTMYLIENLILD